MFGSLALSAATIIGAFTATSEAYCQYAALSSLTQMYLESQGSGEPYDMFLDPRVTYRENNKIVNASSSLIRKPLNIDFSRVIYDQTSCSTFTEVIVTDPRNPYVIGTQLSFNGSDADLTVTLVDSVITTTGDWWFNASRTLELSQNETWSTIGYDERDSRDKLQAAADAYLDMWNKNTSALVPWGTPCDRLEGSGYTGPGLANDTCAVGIPDGKSPPNTDRRYVIDETVGSVSVLFMFQSMGNATDSHQFRLEHGKIRYVHTMTTYHNVATQT